MVAGDPIYIAVMGLVGSGKSTFIDKVITEANSVNTEIKNKNNNNKKSSGKDAPVVPVGRGLISYTCKVHPYSFMHNGRPITLIDTPGFNNATKPDLAILTEISTWLHQCHTSGIQLDGIIYLHRVSDPRMTATAAQNLRVLRRLCGDANLRSVALVTTFWDLQAQEASPMAGNFATNSERRKELLSGPEEMKFWTEMIALGCEPMDYDDEPATGLDVVDYFVTRGRKVVFDIQAEMGAGRPVEETAAGVEVLGPYGREKKAYGAKQKEWESRLKEIELERSRLEQDGRAKGASLESLRSELGRMQERLRNVETKHEQKMLNARAESDTQLRHAMETLRVSEAERHKLTAANAEKDRRIGDLQTRLQTAEHAHAATVNEVNALKSQLSREKDTRRPLNYDPALNVLDSRGEFPLYRAAAGGHYAEVKSLLERGANPRLQTRFRWTSLHWAVQNGHYEVAKLLLEYGASPDVQSDTRATPRGMARTDQMRWLLRQYQG